MINMSEARTLLTELSPALLHVDQQHAAEWGDEILTTVLMGDFAHALVHNWDAVHSTVNKQILNTIETLMVNGDDTVQTAVATGFLESLLNSMLIGEIDRAMVESMLGPESLDYLTEWDKFSDNMYSYRYDKLKEQGLLQSDEARKYANELEKWLEKQSDPSTERAAVERVLQDLRLAMNEI